MKISIVIPCLNERDYLGQTLRHVLNLSGDFEIIVVDGGSTDGTPDIVRHFSKAKLTTSAKGRSLQMNHGSKLATGEILLFLHADTLLPENAYTSIIDIFKDREVVAGSFYLKLDENYWIMNNYSKMSKWNYSFLTYGDHGIFVKKTVFESIGGYKPFPFMEDVEIQGRLKKAGKFKKLNSAVLTSARRFRKNGFFKQLTLDLYLIFLFKIGASPVWLKRFYKDHC